MKRLGEDVGAGFVPGKLEILERDGPLASIKWCSLESALNTASSHGD